MWHLFEIYQPACRKASLAHTWTIVEKEPESFLRMWKLVCALEERVGFWSNFLPTIFTFGRLDVSFKDHVWDYPLSAYWFAFQASIVLNLITIVFKNSEVFWRNTLYLWYLSCNFWICANSSMFGFIMRIGEVDSLRMVAGIINFSRKAVMGAIFTNTRQLYCILDSSFKDSKTSKNDTEWSV